MKIHIHCNRRILAKLEDLDMKLSEAIATMNEIKANLAEASTEILAKLDAYTEAVDADPEEAAALLVELRESAEALANIVPDVPEVPV